MIQATRWRDYLALTKPNVVLLLMVTAVAGMFLATDPPGLVPLRIFIPAFVGLYLAMMSSAAINQIVDQEIDAIMNRTKRRPLVVGTLTRRAAITFATALAIASMVMLYFLVNPLTAWLTLFGFVGYAFIYTMYLKRATPQNIVKASGAGNETRTRDPDLGKVVLYQLSYSRSGAGYLTDSPYPVKAVY